MRSFSAWVLGLFASPAGVIVLAALDSTLFFSLPFGIDAIVIILAARARAVAWVIPMLATIGSLAGAALTFRMGIAAGDKGLERFVSDRQLTRIRRKIKKSGAITLAVLDLIPPPFPFTLFVLAAGALEVRARTFFTTLAACRLFRFGIEGALAIVYGRRIVAVLDSDLFHDIVFGCIVLAALLTTISVIRLMKSTRSREHRAAA